jgi:hypothetical protein
MISILPRMLIKERFLFGYVMTSFYSIAIVNIKIGFHFRQLFVTYNFKLNLTKYTKITERSPVMHLVYWALFLKTSPLSFKQNN